jgi:hypothetical protein
MPIEQDTGGAEGEEEPPESSSEGGVEDASTKSSSRDGDSPENSPIGDDLGDLLPLELNVKWKGKVLTSETRLELTESGIGVEMPRGSTMRTVGYDFVQLQGEGGKKVTVRAPVGFGEDAFTTRYSFVFESEEDRELFLKAYRKHHDPERSDELIDNRYWYNRKRWAIPLALFMVPVILWNGYQKYVASEGDREWFESELALLVQGAWFFPIGLYGLYDNSSVSGTKRGGIGVAALFLFCLFFVEISEWKSYKEVNKFQNNKDKIISRLTENRDLEEAIENGENYVLAFRNLEKRDDRLFEVVDSLRVRRVVSLAEKAQDAAPQDLERAEDFLEKSRFLYDEVEDSLSSVESKMSEIDERLANFRKHGKCYNISGLYTGTCNVQQGGRVGITNGRLNVKPNCDYNLDGNRLIPLESSLEFTDEEGRYLMRDDDYMVRYRGQVEFSYDAGNYTATCRLQN